MLITRRIGKLCHMLYAVSLHPNYFKLVLPYSLLYAHIWRKTKVTQCNFRCVIVIQKIQPQQIKPFYYGGCTHWQEVTLLTQNHEWLLAIASMWQKTKHGPILSSYMMSIADTRIKTEAVDHLWPLLACQEESGVKSQWQNRREQSKRKKSVFSKLPQ